MNIPWSRIRSTDCEIYGYYKKLRLQIVPFLFFIVVGSETQDPVRIKIRYRDPGLNIPGHRYMTFEFKPRYKNRDQSQWKKLRIHADRIQSNTAFKSFFI